MDLFSDPTATRNIPGGLAHLKRWHSRRNAEHPLRREERKAAGEWFRQHAPVEKPAAGKRPKKPPPVPDPDGKYRL